MYIPKGSFIVMKTGTHPMRTRLQLFLNWGITFGEPYVVPERANRAVAYANRVDLERNLPQLSEPEEMDESRGYAVSSRGGIAHAPAQERAVKRGTTCAITGHRPTRFRFKYDENNNGCKRIKKRIRDQLIRLYEQGFRQFWVGGALGVDMWAGEILLRLKEQPEYSEIQLMIALPFEGHDRNWDERSRKRMAFLIQHSSETVSTGQKDAPPAVNYRRRNEYIVDRAGCLLAVYDNDCSIRSGTGMTVNYARKQGLPIILIHPDKATILKEKPER